MALLAKANRLPDHIATGVHNANYIAWLWEVEGIELGSDNNLEQDCAFEQWPVLFGDWTKKNGQFVPKRGCRFAAIFNPETNTVQVVKSIFCIRCHPCSPCYPGQGDVDSVGTTWAFCLPPEYMNQKWVAENRKRIFENCRTSSGSNFWRRWRA